MAKQVFDEVTTTGIVHDGSKEEWEFTEASSVHVADGAALTISGASNDYTLSGALTSDSDDALVVTGADNDIVIGKTATLTGDIRLTSASGGNTLDVRGGVIDGSIVVTPSYARNILITDNSDYHFSGGYNEVMASVDYKLNSFEHKLRLLGSDNINGTGNDASNQIHGNSGDNILDGKLGADVMNGGAGDDTIICDDGDHIVFRKGGDHDTMVNFAGRGSGGVDTVEVDNVWNVTDFAQAQTHMSQHGDDAWLDLEHGDRLIFKDFHFHDFRPDDFSFGFTN